MIRVVIRGDPVVVVANLASSLISVKLDIVKGGAAGHIADFTFIVIFSASGVGNA